MKVDVTNASQKCFCRKPYICRYWLVHWRLQMNLIHLSSAFVAHKAAWAAQLEYFTEMRQVFCSSAPLPGGNLFGWAGQMATDNWNHCTQRSVILQQRLWCPVLTSHVFHLSVLYFVSYFSVTIFIAFFWGGGHSSLIFVTMFSPKFFEDINPSKHSG